jgi:IS5 family transposase
VKSGKTPEEWEKQPAKNRQKDKDARWTKKHGRSHFGYKNHVCIDRRHKLVRRYGVTSASVHDSQKLDDLLDPDNTASTVWAKPLTARQEAANKTRSSVRARVEHVFGNQHTSMGGKLVRTIGIVRATMKIGMQNLAYNMRRLVVLERGTLAAA